MSLVIDLWPHLDQCTHTPESPNGFVVCNQKRKGHTRGNHYGQTRLHFYFLLMVEMELKSTTSTMNSNEEAGNSKFLELMRSTTFILVPFANQVTFNYLHY
jgi:hypothetical protein